MKWLLRVFSGIHAFMALLCCLRCADVDRGIGAHRLVGVRAGLDRAAAEAIIEAVGLLAAAVVALQVAQTITEEEVVRDAHISAPTRVRRFLSRFMVVIVVALAVEGLVATFRAHDDPAQLLYAGGMVCSVGLLLAGWGLFVTSIDRRKSWSPRQMAEAKREDHKLGARYRFGPLKLHHGSSALSDCTSPLPALS